MRAGWARGGGGDVLRGGRAHRARAHSGERLLQGVVVVEAEVVAEPKDDAAA